MSEKEESHEQQDKGASPRRSQRRSPSESESDYSISQIRKAEKRKNKKKVTKMIHTCCIVKILPNGQKVTKFKHFTKDSVNKDPSTLKKQAEKSGLDHNRLLVAEERRKVNIPERSLFSGVPSFQTQPMAFP